LEEGAGSAGRRAGVFRASNLSASVFRNFAGGSISTRAPVKIFVEGRLPKPYERAPMPAMRQKINAAPDFALID
jgi:hypothetical protein